MNNERPRYALTGAEMAYVEMAVRLRSAIANAVVDEQAALWGIFVDDMGSGDASRCQMAATEIWKRVLPDFRSGSSAGSASVSSGGLYPGASLPASDADAASVAGVSGSNGTAPPAGTRDSSRERRRY